MGAWGSPNEKVPEGFQPKRTLKQRLGEEANWGLLPEDNKKEDSYGRSQ